MGGFPYDVRKRNDFITVIEVCGLLDIGFSGHKFSRTNNRGIIKRIWKRLYWSW